MPSIMSLWHTISKIPENVAIANALQLEAVRRRAVPVRFNFVAHVKFEVAQPIHCRLKSVFTAYMLRYDATLNFDPVTLTFDFEHLCHVPCAKFCTKFERNPAIHGGVIAL